MYSLFIFLIIFANFIFLYFPDRNRYIACEASSQNLELRIRLLDPYQREGQINEYSKMDGWSIAEEDGEICMIKT